MRILQSFTPPLTQDDYTLLCECAKQKSAGTYPLHERTLMRGLQDRHMIRFNRHANAYELTEFGLFVLDSIVAELPRGSSFGPAKMLRMPRK